MPDEEFVVVGVSDRLEIFPSHFQYSPATQLSVRQETDHVDAAVQCDFEARDLNHIIDTKNRCIEGLQRKINMQQEEIASIKKEIEACKKEHQEKLSNMRRPCEETYRSAEHVHVQCHQTGVNEGTLPSFSQKCRERSSNQLPRHSYTSPQLSETGHVEPANGAAAAAERAHKECVARASSVCECQGAAVCRREAEITRIINHQMADCKEECKNLVSNLFQRMEKAQAELRDQCFEYCAASERRLRQEISTEREKVLSCFREMALLRDYVTAMTDVVETMTSSYMTKADASTSKTEPTKAWQCETVKTPPAT